MVPDQKLPAQKLPTAKSPQIPQGTDDNRDGLFIGRKTFNASADSAVIPVGVEAGRFDKIRLRSLDSGLRLGEARIIYTTGAPDVLTLEMDVAANTRTPWLPVSSDRVVREIALTYRGRGPARSMPTVEIYGDLAEGYLDPAGDGSRSARTNGWVPLGAKSVALRQGVDQLDVQIARNRGGFKRLRVDAKERAITLREVRVIYATGEDEIITIDNARQRIAAGASFGPIELRGGSRAVKDVILKTRSRLLESEVRGRDATIVEIWGQL